MLFVLDNEGEMVIIVLMRKRVEATIRQKKAAKLIATNPGKPLKEIMIEAGYSENSAHNPRQALLSKKGFLQICDDYGLTDELILTSLVEDIKGKPGRRVQELTLGADIRGMRQRGAYLQVNILQGILEDMSSYSKSEQ